MSQLEKVANAMHVHQLIRDAVKRGHGEEALRLANKYKVPNLIRNGLGVELSSNPSEAPEIEIG